MSSHLVVRRLIKLIRSRGCLSIILLCSIVYFIVQTGLYNVWSLRIFSNIAQRIRYPQVRRYPTIDDGEALQSLRQRLLHRDVQSIETPTRPTPSATSAIKCRNTRQGATWLTDDRGYTCLREHVLKDGCCADETRQHSCETCDDRGCCRLFEFCVSCCLRPSVAINLRTIMGNMSDNRLRSFLGLTDHFDMCLNKCRINSNSVDVHNAYWPMPQRHCYGKET